MMANNLIGPMCIEEFFQGFLPKPDTSPEFEIYETAKQNLQRVANHKSENKMYAQLIEALKPFSCDFVFEDTRSHPDPDSRALTQGDLKPGIILYPPNITRTGVTNISMAEVLFEFKSPDDSGDPVSLKDADFVRVWGTTSQLTSYVAAQFASRFRIHAFSVLIVDGFVRLIYWDRFGAVVTESFPLTDPHLADFIWRYTRSTAKVRGIDATMIKPTVKEIENVPKETHVGMGLASFDTAGDLGRDTRLHDYMERTWEDWGRKMDLRPHEHHRLILGVVTRGLTSFRSTHELITAFRDAIIAHDQIFSAGFMRCDISFGNILITKGGEGIMIDFDLCKFLSDLSKSARQRKRSSARQFMSVRIQMSGRLLHSERADDLESFLHVLTWVSLRFVPHKLEPNFLARYLENIFEHSSTSNSITTRGLHKQHFLKGKPIRDFGFEEGPFFDLLKTLTDTFCARYEEISPDSTERSALLELGRKDRLQRLESSEWIIKFLTDSLKGPGWPMNDTPIKNPVGRATSSTIYFHPTKSCVSFKRRSSWMRNRVYVLT